MMIMMWRILLPLTLVALDVSSSSVRADVDAGGHHEGDSRQRRLSGSALVQAKQEVNAFDIAFHEASRLIKIHQRDDAIDDDNNHHDVGSGRFVRALKGESNIYNYHSKNSKSSKKPKGKGYAKGSGSSSGSDYSAGSDDEKDYGDNSAGTCEDRLAQCEAEAGEPRDLFVQMANSCSIVRLDNGTMLLTSGDYDDDTYSFTDRPIRFTDTIKTKDFFEDFNVIFDDSKPNAAVTLHSDNADGTGQFEGPIISIFIDTAYEDTNGVNYTYVLSQSDEQKAIIDLDEYFQDENINAVSFQDCSIFIDTVQAQCKIQLDRLEKCLSRPDKDSCPHWVNKCYNACNRKVKCNNIINEYQRVGEPSYCRARSDFSCYRSGWPACCSNNRGSDCPRQQPGCDNRNNNNVAYCNAEADWYCYVNGHPECCLSTNRQICPRAKPGCDNIQRRNYCDGPANYNCYYDRGYPSCCFSNYLSCPVQPPPCGWNS